MRSIMLSIKPKYVALIANGEKTIEVRKTAPKCEVPFKCYIYATRPKKYYKCGAVSTSDELLWLANGKIEMGDGFKFWADGDEYQCLNGRIIGEFICDKVDKIIPLQHTYYNYIGLPIARITEYGIWNDDLAQMCLKKKEIDNYGKGKMLYGWHISDLKIYDEPKKLTEFYKCGAESFEELSDTEDLCSYCSRTGFCEGRWCDEAYQNYLDVDFALTHAPQSWCYVEELKEIE